MLHLASIGNIYVNLLESKIYLDTALIILKLWFLTLTFCNIGLMFKIAEILLLSV